MDSFANLFAIVWLSSKHTISQTLTLRRSGKRTSVQTLVTLRVVPGNVLLLAVFVGVCHRE